LIVTSFSQKGYHEYGKRFIESFLKNWKDESLVVYYEKNLPKDHPVDDRVSYINLTEFEDFNRFADLLKKSDPMFSGIMRGGKDGERVYNFRYDAHRFFRKVCAITEHAFRTGPHLFAWCDADVIFHSAVPLNFLRQLLPDQKDMMAALLRPHSYTECGFMVFDMNHPLAETFMRQYWAMYATGAFRFAGEWHDSFLFDMVRTLVDVPVHDITEGKETDHPFIHSILGKYADHLKGERKKVGRSDYSENKAGHKGAYWQKPAEQEAVNS